jgi:integrase
MGRKASTIILYNEKNKIAYFKDCDLKQNTKDKDKTCFIKIAGREKLLEKDLYEFDENEVISFFVSRFTNSRTTARNYHSVFKQYVKWSIKSGLKKININPFDKLKFEKDIWPIMEKSEQLEKICLTEEKIWKMVDEAKDTKNAQDIVCIIPVFYGIRGIKCSELINLKKEDVDSVKNTVILDTEVSTRIIHLPQEIIEIFKNSSEQEIYNRRGKPGYGERITSKLMESEYVIRPSTINGNGYIGAVRLAQRCKEFLEDAGYPDMCIDDIYVSGKLNLLKHIQQKNGKIEIDNYRDVQGRFGDNADNYNNIKVQYELAMLNEKFNVLTEKSFWDEIYLVDNKDIFLYEDENDMNNPDKTNLSEGNQTITNSKHYARSHEARNRCIEIYGATCYICKFNFEQTYGEFGKGLIHVHHLEQLSKSNGKHIVNAREDLRPVCPNCHFIIHKDKKKTCSIESVEKMIKDNKSAPNGVAPTFPTKPTLRHKMDINRDFCSR